MSQFKIGDRVKIVTGAFSGKIATVVKINCGLYCFNVELEDNPEWAYSEHELEMIDQKPKTKTVRKYASVIFDNDGNIKPTIGFYTEEFLKKAEKDYFDSEKIYHIVTTIFQDVEVPIETETRWAFICKNPCTGNYYPTSQKYNSIEQAKSRTLNQAIAKIDDSAEEFEIE